MTSLAILTGILVIVMAVLVLGLGLCLWTRARMRIIVLPPVEARRGPDAG